MTSFSSETVTCVNCHKDNSHHVLVSTNRFGYADLDLRPPEMERSTMNAWIQCCPHCVYCAPDLSKPSGDLSVMTTPEYPALLGDVRYPELARRFLLNALLNVASNPAGAARSRLCAAWVCDDAARVRAGAQWSV